MPQPSATKPLGLPFIELQSVDSTNNYARRQIHAGLAQHGMAFFAEEQTEGKGQRGKSWLTEKGANIILSVVVNPFPLSIVHQFRLNACVAVAVREFFARYAGEETTIKWPNDLFWQDRKAGGILIENIIEGQKDAAGRRNWHSIIGIGININQTHFNGDLRNPVSLRQITGRTYDAATLGRELCEVLDKRFNQLMQSGFELLYATYLAHLYKRNQQVRFRKDNRVFEATVLGVSPNGKLQTRHAIDQEFEFGELEWIL